VNAMRAPHLILAYVVTAAAAHNEVPAIQQVCERMAQTKSQEAVSIRNYTVIRHYRLAVPHAGHVAEMMVRLTYAYPGHKKFEVLWERGSNSIQKRVFKKLLTAEEDASRFDTRVTADNYNFQMEGVETVNGRKCYVLRIEPRGHGKYLLRGKAWVDAVDYAVVRVEGEPVEDGSFWIRNTHVAQVYKKVAGFWFLPRIRRIRKSGSLARRISPSKVWITRSAIRMLRTGLTLSLEVEIRYWNSRIFPDTIVR